MAKYKITYSNDGYDSEGALTIDVPTGLIRQYATIVNASIAKVLAQADVLLILAEDGKLNPDDFLAKGLEMNVE